MLVLRLKRGQKIAVGKHILRVVTIYKNCVDVKYKDEIHRITDSPKDIGELTAVFQKQEGVSVRLAFNSPHEIWRLQDREKAI